MFYRITFIIILSFFTSLCFGQHKVVEINKFDFKLTYNSNVEFRYPQFKFTLADSWFGRDKVHHCLTSAFLSGVGYYFLHEEQNFSNPKSQFGGFCFSLSLGLIKEVRDGLKPNNAFSFKDLAADILGTAVGILLVSDL
jgi:putative lipoprotein